MISLTALAVCLGIFGSYIPEPTRAPEEVAIQWARAKIPSGIVKVDPRLLEIDANGHPNMARQEYRDTLLNEKLGALVDGIIPLEQVRKCDKNSCTLGNLAGFVALSKKTCMTETKCMLYAHLVQQHKSSLNGLFERDYRLMFERKDNQWVIVEQTLVRIT